MSNLNLSPLAFAVQKNPYLAFVVALLAGLYFIRFARACYSSPYIMLEKWYKRELPQKNWARQLLRGVAVVWIFFGFAIIGSALLNLPFFEEYPGRSLAIAALTIAILGTVLVLWQSSRQREKVEPPKAKGQSRAM